MVEEKDLNDVSVLANLADNEIWKVPVGNLVNAIENAADTIEYIQELLAAAEKERDEAEAQVREFDIIAEKILDPEYMKSLTESEIVVGAVKRTKMAEKDRDHWKFEYENVCKFATQYEGERDGLEAALGRAREALKKLRQFVEQDYWRQVIDEALSSIPATDGLEEARSAVIEAANKLIATFSTSNRWTKEEVNLRDALARLSEGRNPK